MVFFSHMVNAWSLAWEALNGTMDEEYPIIDTSVGAGNTATDFEIDDLDYEIDYYNDSADCMADIDDMYFHHLTNANSSYNDGWTQEYHQEQLDKIEKIEVTAMDYEPKRNHQYKYHEEEILKDIEEYVLSLIHISEPTRPY